jgi:hypothetical protein
LTAKTAAAGHVARRRARRDHRDVAILAFRHRAQVWELYLMNTLVAAGFWMFWPTITALIQELTPEGEFVQSNTFLWLECRADG